MQLIYNVVLVLGIQQSHSDIYCIYAYILYNTISPCCLFILYIVVCICGEGNGTPLQYSCLENPMEGGAWWAAIYGVAQSRTRLKQLSSSSSSSSVYM